MTSRVALSSPFDSGSTSHCSRPPPAPTPLLSPARGPGTRPAHVARTRTLRRLGRSHPCGSRTLAPADSLNSGSTPHEFAPPPHSTASLSPARAALALAPLTKRALPVPARTAPAHPEASAAHTPLVRAHLPGPAPRRAHSPASPSSRPRPSLSLSARFSRFSLFASHSLPAAVRTRRLGCAAASGDHGQGVRVHAPPPRPGDGWEGEEGGWGREGGKGRRRKREEGRVTGRGEWVRIERVITSLIPAGARAARLHSHKSTCPPTLLVGATHRAYIYGARATWGVDDGRSGPGGRGATHGGGTGLWS